MRLMIAAVLTLGLAGCSGLPWVSAPQGEAPSERLETLMGDVWEMGLSFNPHYATYFGASQYNDQHPDLSPDAVAQRQAVERAALDRLRSIDRGALTDEQQLNFDLLEALLVDGAGSWLIDGVSAHPFEIAQMPLNTMGGVQLFSQVLSFTPFDTAQDYRNYLKRLTTLDVYIDQVIGQMRLGIESGWVVPKPVASTVAGQVETMVTDTADAHPLYAPLTRMPESIAADERDALQAAAAEAIRNQVVPAYRTLHAFIRDEYLPAARDSIAASDLPAGRTFYDYWVRRMTTTSIDAETIHDNGLREVERLRGAMTRVMRETGFKGDLEAFGEMLRTDDRFYFKTGEEALEAHLAFAKRIDPLMTQLFGRLPRMPYGIKPMPEAAAKFGGPPYYNGPSDDGTRAGYFFVNTMRPELQPAFSMPALVAHEAVPGHHFQIALSQELRDLPEFRRNGGYTAYIEGWALYAETLGDEVGMYRDPYEQFGRLASEIWRAIRLVVDTGMHAKGWSRQQAIDFFSANSPEPQARIVAEIDRYISIPGQALSYKMGQLRISALRGHASDVLGDAFDRRAFHDEVLRVGALPLDVLDRRIRAWVRSQSQGKNISTEPEA